MILYILGLLTLGLFFLTQILGGDEQIIRAVATGEADVSNLEKVWVTKSYEENTLYRQITGYSLILFACAIPGVYITQKLHAWSHRGERRILE